MLIAFRVASQTLGLDANSAGRVPLEGHVRKGVRNRKDEGRDFEGGGGDQPPERMIKRLGSPTWRGRARQITQNRVAVTEYGTSILPKAKMGRLIWFTV